LRRKQFGARSHVDHSRRARARVHNGGGELKGRVRLCLYAMKVRRLFGSATVEASVQAAGWKRHDRHGR
jgi:hypothetical protein